MADELLTAAGPLSSPADVNRPIRSVLRAMIQRRLSPKEAGILCYIAQTSLHSQRALCRQQQLDAEAHSHSSENDEFLPLMLTWNLPPREWIDAHPQEYAAICQRLDRSERPQK